MTTGVISVTEETRLPDIAALFERKRIKRVPVVKDGKLVGIVTRAQSDSSARLGGRPDRPERRNGPPNPA
jgi:predicted transcriptional regulator